MTIWNSPADVTGTATVDDGGKKDSKGTLLYLYFEKTFLSVIVASGYVARLCLSVLY